jgi:hypothetical protein
MSEGNDEQDLVKALDDVAGAASSIPVSVGSQPGTGAVASPFQTTVQPLVDAQTVDPPTVAPYLSSDSSSFAPTPSAPSFGGDDNGPLASIKKDALTELRPLVDKLNVSAEEKFDTYLLLIRSTDDAELIGPAHEAAKQITDETRRAEALLDVIKEIDYLSHPKADA